VRAFEKWPNGDKPVFVLSSKPLEPAAQPVERLDGEPSEVLKTLEARGIGHVYVDGGLTIQRFLRAGLVDRMVITRLPVLIGEGIPLFGALGRDVRLKHVSTRVIGDAAVQSVYEVLR
jgi:dihydrofolate reductase